MGSIEAKETLVLLIEDNPADAELVRIALDGLEGWNFRTRNATCLADACRLLAEYRFDVVVSDLGLPDANGLEAVAGVREVAPGVPLVVLTGDSDISVGVSAVGDGAHAYVVKGWDNPDILAARIVDAIARGRVIGALSVAQTELSESSSRLSSIRPKVRAAK